MSEDTNKHGYYFTFPITFLHVGPKDYKERCGLIINWSINEMIRRGKVKGITSPTKKEAQIRKILNFTGGSLHLWETGWSKLQSLLKGGEIYTSVKTDYLFDTRDGKLDPCLLLLVAAFRSVIGMKRNFCLTNRRIIVHRMYGNNPDQLTRYSFDKLCDKASGRGMITRIPAGRGFYVSIRYNSDQLRDAVEARINKYYSEKQQQADAGRKIALLKRERQHKLKKTPQLNFN